MKLVKGLRDKAEGLIPSNLKPGDIIVFGYGLQETVRKIEDDIVFFDPPRSVGRWGMYFDSPLWAKAKLKK